MNHHGYPEPPKSACVGCPYHNDARMKMNKPAQFADAVAFDNDIRGGFGKSEGELFVHRSLQPLGEVDLANATGCSVLHPLQSQNTRLLSRTPA